MNKLPLTMAFWAAACSAILFIIFSGCFIGIALTSPIYEWTNINDYITYTTTHSQLLKYIAQTAMLLFGPAFVILVASIHEMAGTEQKILTRNALVFAGIFATLIGIHYFVQISAVRINLLNGHFQGIEHFLQGKPDSAFSAINMLGWTLFLGLSSLMLAPVFQRAIRFFFIINGVCCLLAGLGYVFENTLLVFLTINLGMGGCVTLLGFFLTFHYWKALRKV